MKQVGDRNIYLRSNFKLLIKCMRYLGEVVEVSGVSWVQREAVCGSVVVLCCCVLLILCTLPPLQPSTVAILVLPQMANAVSPLQPTTL